jgi:hypothetical protein
MGLDCGGSGGRWTENRLSLGGVQSHLDSDGVCSIPAILNARNVPLNNKSQGLFSIISIISGEVSYCFLLELERAVELLIKRTHFFKGRDRPQEHQLRSLVLQDHQHPRSSNSQYAFLLSLA